MQDKNGAIHICGLGPAHGVCGSSFPNKKMFEEIKGLCRELSDEPRPLSWETFTAELWRTDQIFLVAQTEKHGPVIGMGTVPLFFSPARGGLAARLEDFVVSSEYRGLGIGAALLHALIFEAKKCGAEVMELSSNSRRTEAIALYKKFGFQKRETDVFELPLSS